MALTGDFSGAGSIGQATTIPTPADHATRLAAATYTGLDRTNVQSDTKVFTVASSPAANTNGELTLNTTDLTNGPTLRAQMYDGDAAVHIDLAEAIYSASTPAAGYQIPGMLWRDLTLFLWRRYESDTTAPNGVAGWHPVSDAYQLWKNESGGDLAANLVVVEKTSGTDGKRAFTTTTTEKNQLVLGVMMEAITNNSYGVVAMVSGGATCLVSVLGSTFGAVAKGDALVCSTTAGKAREAGPLAGAVTPTVTAQYAGLQMGAFAEALEATSSDTTIKVRLLGQVGRGLWVWHSKVLLWDQITPEVGGPFIIDARKVSDGGTGGGQGAVTLQDASHAPLVGFGGFLRGTGSKNAYTSWILAFNKDNSSNNEWEIYDNSGDVSNPDYDRSYSIQFVPLASSALAATTPGNLFDANYTAVSSSVTWTAFRIYRTCYLC